MYDMCRIQDLSILKRNPELQVLSNHKDLMHRRHWVF
jgi:hypothetical protein